jgi:hypothetical protein
MQALTTNFQIDYELSDLTPRELAEQIIGRLEKTFSVDLLSIFGSAAFTEQQKILRFKDALFNAVLKRAETENLSEFFLAPEGFTEHEERDYLKAETGYDAGDAADVQEISLVPNIALTESDAKIVKSYTGDDLKTYLFNLTKRFENMAGATTSAALTAEMLLGGVISVGVPAAVKTALSLQQGLALRAAITAGIKGIGLSAAIGLVLLAFSALLMWLFVDNPKKLLGMVVNLTNKDLIVRDFRKSDGDLYVNAGEIQNFMEDNVDGLDSPKIQLKKMLSAKPDDKDHVVLTGIYFVDKKFGAFGAEGLALFSSRDSKLRFAHLFASPYTRDNGTNMAFVPGTDKVDLKKLFDELYGSRGVQVTVKNEDYELVSTVNAPRGGVVGCIASVTAKTT